MFDIGFFELALIGVVLLVVMGPERLPEVARQLAFVIRKARGWMYNMKAEMSLSDDPMLQELKQAKDELSDLGRDMRQLGDDFAQEAAQLNDRLDLDSKDPDAVVSKRAERATVSKPKKASAGKVSKKTTKKVAKKTTKKVSKKPSVKPAKKTATKKTATKKTATKKTTKKVAKKVTKKTAAKKGASKA